MEFKKFSSLENTYREHLFDKLLHEGKSGGQWVVSEKIDGANFSFWCDGKVVKVASRTQFVDGTFFGCQPVIDRYSQGILDYCQTNGVGSLVIYGELYGRGIQNRVEYGEKDFRAFDVVVDGEVLDKFFADHISSACGIISVPYIHTGTLDECMSVANTFKSLLTPTGHEGDNFAEGVVIEPDIPCWFGSGQRIYFKNKSPSFCEKGAKRKVKEHQELPEEVLALLESVLSYNTPQRVLSVISKIGEVSNRDFGKILGLTCQDIFEDFEKDTGVDCKVVAGECWKTFVKAVQSDVSLVVRGEFVKHI